MHLSAFGAKVHGGGGRLGSYSTAGNPLTQASISRGPVDEFLNQQPKLRGRRMA